MSDTLTAEQIEEIRTYVGCNLTPRMEDINALCDLAIKGLQRPDLEAAALKLEEIAGRLGRIENVNADIAADDIRAVIDELATGQDAQVQDQRGEAALVTASQGSGASGATPDTATASQSSPHPQQEQS